MLPDKLSGKKTPVMQGNYHFVPDNVCDQPLIFRLELSSTFELGLSQISFQLQVKMISTPYFSHPQPFLHAHKT
jgi:hypothetical protein